MITIQAFERALLRGDAHSLRLAGLPDAAALVTGHLDYFLPQNQNQNSSHSPIPAHTLSVRIAHQCALAAARDVTIQTPLLTHALTQNPNIDPIPLFSAYVAAVSLLQVFLRDNWTGPKSDVDPPGPQSDAAPLYLSLDGEDVLRSAKSLYCLRAARFILVDSRDVFLRAGASLVSWWSARTLFAHQIILSNPVPTLQNLLFHMFACFLGPNPARTGHMFTSFSNLSESTTTPVNFDLTKQSATIQHDNDNDNDNDDNDDDDDDNILPAPIADGDDQLRDEDDSYICVLDDKRDGTLLVLAHLELALAQKYYYDSDSAIDSLRRSSEFSQVAIRMSGEMGTRTKHQVKETAQLVARAYRINDQSRSTRPDLGEDQFAIKFPCVPQKISESNDRTAEIRFKPNDLPLPQDVQVNDTDVLGYVKLSEVTPSPLKKTKEQEIDDDDHDDSVFQLIEDCRLGDEIDSLTPLEQALALAHASIVRARNAAHTLTNEEMAAYVDVALRNAKSSHGSSSMVQMRALLYRVSFERNRGRFLERCMAQMDVLAKYVDNPMTESNAEIRALSTAERTALVLASSMPPRWELMKELAISFGKIGLVKSAMDIFEKNEFWDELVDCHRLIGNLGRAEALVREHLELLDAAVVNDGIIRDEEKGFDPLNQISNRAVQERAARRPRLLCVLGEVTRDATHFETAWNESGGRYARAKRALARLCVEREDWANAVNHFQDALRVNPLFPDAWFSYGCAALKIGDIRLASNAFTMVVQQMPENAEAWNNLGRTLYDTGKKKEALKAITEAAKLHRDSWRIWTNVVVLASELRSTLDIVRGMERLLDLRGKEGILSDAIGIAVIEVGQMSTSKDVAIKRNLQQICNRLLKILARCTTLVSTNPSIWAAYAELHELITDKDSRQKAFDCRLKQVRSLIARGNWKTERTVFRHMAIACDAMVRDAVETCVDSNVNSARMQLDSVITQSMEMFKEDEGFARLIEARDRMGSNHGTE